MSDITQPRTRVAPVMAEPTAWGALKANKNWLGFWFMAPAIAILVLFLAYPLVLGVWMSFTDARIRSEEHTSELQSRQSIAYAVFCV